MESQPQDPEFRNNPETFHPCIIRESNCLHQETDDLSVLISMQF